MPLSLAIPALILCAVLERCLPRRVQAVLRPAWRTDVLFLVGQSVIFGGLAVLVLGWTHRLVVGLVPVADWPLPLKVVLAVTLGDVVVYWFHRACHAVPVLWRFHAVHHSSESLDWLAAFREHPVDGVLTQVALNLPAMLLDVPLGALLGLVFFRGFWAVVIHANVRLPLGPLAWLIGAPELHHWHHARTPGRVANFGNLAPWTDWLFGTLHRPEGEERWPLGVPEPMPRTWWGLLAWPLAGDPRARLVAAGLAGVMAHSALAAPDGGADPLLLELSGANYLPATKSFGPMQGGVVNRLGGLRATPPRLLVTYDVTSAGDRRDEAWQAVRRRLSGFTACLESGQEPRDVSMQLAVTAAGKVERVRFAADAGAVSSCLERQAALLVFPTAKGRSDVSVALSSRLNPEWRPPLDAGSR